MQTHRDTDQEESVTSEIVNLIVGNEAREVYSNRLSAATRDICHLENDVISFSDDDLVDVMASHDDALVITGKIKGDDIK